MSLPPGIGQNKFECKIDDNNLQFWLNKRVHVVYSKLHKLALSVHEILDDRILDGQDEKENHLQTILKRWKPQDHRDSKFFVDRTYYDQSREYVSILLATRDNYNGDLKMKESMNTYANVVPVIKGFNQVDWLLLEDYVRSLRNVDKFMKMEVITGPIFYEQNNPLINEKVKDQSQETIKLLGIIVPSQFYKIVIVFLVGGKRYIGCFRFENKRNNRYDLNKKTLKKYIMNIQNLRRMTGLKFDVGECEQLQSLDKIYPKKLDQTIQNLHREKIKNASKLMNAVQFKEWKDRLDATGIRLDQQQRQSLSQLQHGVFSGQRLAQSIQAINTKHSHDLAKRIFSILKIHKVYIHYGNTSNNNQFKAQIPKWMQSIKIQDILSSLEFYDELLYQIRIKPSFAIYKEFAKILEDKITNAFRLTKKIQSIQ